MDLKTIKAKAKELKNKAKEYWEKALDFSSEKLASSSLTISKKAELDSFIKKSENKKFNDPRSWEEKIFVKRVITIFWDENSNFFKEALYILPVLASKAFSQNTTIKLVKVWEDIKLNDYKLKELPALIVFENEKPIKQVLWKENILKLVKSFNLDINSEIDKL